MRSPDTPIVLINDTIAAAIRAVKRYDGLAQRLAPDDVVGCVDFAAVVVVAEDGRRDRLQLERTDVDPAAEDARKWRAALIELGHATGASHRARIARINRRAARQERVRERRPAIGGQRAEHRTNSSRDRADKVSIRI